MAREQIALDGGDGVVRNIVMESHEHAPGWRASLQSEHDLEGELIPVPAAAPRAVEQPVVYLDQLHWVTLAQTRRTPEKIKKPGELDAAHELWRMVESGAVSLPLSAGHLRETFGVQAAGRRKPLVVTMLEGSRGCLMRNSSSVRVYELVRAFTRETDLACQEVFAYDWRLLKERAGSVLLGDPLPRIDAEEWASEHLRYWVPWIHVMLEGDDTKTLDPAHPSLHAGTRWAQNAQEFVDFLRANKDVTLRRARTLVWVDADGRAELSAAAGVLGLSESDAQWWYGDVTDPSLPTLEQRYASMPSWHIYREMVYARMCNTSDPWTKNDLVDLTSLSCAAAYADHVVTERKMGRYLRSATTKRAQVHTSIAEIVTALGAPSLSQVPRSGDGRSGTSGQR